MDGAELEMQSMEACPLVLGVVMGLIRLERATMAWVRWGGRGRDGIQAWLLLMVAL